jgi:non-specific serine/threonine protein kinase
MSHPTGSPGAYVFLSYASADRERASHIADLLETQGISVWLDRRSIAGGTSWSTEIVRGIRGCAVFALACSPASVASPNVQQETQLAWESRRPILPLLLERAELPEAIVYALAGRQWIEVLDGPVEEWLPQAVRALGGLGIAPRPSGASVAPAASPLASEESPIPPLVPAHHNLPAPLTSFVGREQEVGQVRSLLATSRLVTLTGTGGCGKTRLALHVAAEVVGGYPNGVWLVELAALGDPSLVPQAVATALGVRDEPGQPLRATLLAALRARRLLLVLDNCEHLLDACAHLADALLQACSDLCILATSREALGIVGEVSWRVPSLTVPVATPRGPADVLACESARLFCERARAVDPAFAVTGQNAAALAEICRRLDGIPLALELAAARVRVLSVERIAARLDDRFRLLTGGSRTALARQQTLRAAIDWSYNLLSDPERQLVRRLAVFVGGCSLEAVEAVCGGDGIAGDEVLDLLSALVDKSLVLADRRDGVESYRLLETIRQYAGEKLREAGEADAVRARHRAWYRELVERAERELSGPRQRLWLDRIEGEYDNLRAVLEGSVADPTFLEDGLRMARALERLWIARGYLGEGRHLLAALLASAVAIPAVRGSAARMAALYAASFLAFFQGDFAASGSLAEECLALARDLGDERGIWYAVDNLVSVALNQGDYPRATALSIDVLAAMQRLEDRNGIGIAQFELAILARLQGEYQRAVVLCEKCLALWREAGDLWFIAQVLSNLGLTRYQQGQYSGARGHFVEALALRRELDDRSGIAWSLINLGDVELAQGDDAAARTRFVESLALLRDLGDRAGSADALASLGRAARAQGDLAAARTYSAESLVIRRDLGQRLAMPAILEDLAGLAAAQGSPTGALTLASAALALRDTLGAPRSPAEREQIERWLGSVRTALGEEAAAAALASGQAMTLEQAVAYALSDDNSQV